MKTSLNQSTIEKSKPKKKAYEIRDTKLPGLLVRVQPSGVKTYYCEYRRGSRVKIGRFQTLSVKDARERAKDILKEVYAGGDPALAMRRKRKAISYDLFLKDHYAPWALINHTNKTDVVDKIRCGCADLLNKRILELTHYEVEKWRMSKLSNGLSPSTINRYYTALRSTLSKAVEWEFLPSHPLQKMRPLKTDPNLKVRYLTKDEETRLRKKLDERENQIREKRNRGNIWRAERGYQSKPDLTGQIFADHLKPMILLSMNTGMRRGEVFKLKWCNVNFEINQLTIVGSTAKSGKTRHIPLNKEALKTLDSWRKQRPNHETLVFTNQLGGPFDNVKKSWGSLLKMANIEDFRWHDLRHHFASKLVMAGVNLNTVRELLGHSSYAMTLRYSHLSAGHKAEAVELLASSR